MITNDKKFISIKNAILNPTSLAIIISLPIFVFNIHFPTIFEDGINLLGKMVTPMCMVILGMRLSAVNLKVIFTRLFVYITCLLKLVVYPVFVYLLVRWLPVGNEVLRSSVIVLAMVPAGAIMESLAELHECEQELAANVVLLTTILSVITIPIMVTLLV